jgi:hypothetical protein
VPLADQPSIDEYSPVVVEYFLKHWRQLEDACRGVSAANYSGSRGGRHGRITLIAIKADLERAADELPLHWTSTLYIFKLQGRWKVYLERRAEAHLPAGTTPGLDFEQCCERMAKSLGWMGEKGEAA